LTSATIAAIAGIGNLRPLEECTQVTPSARVSGRIARRSRATISSALAPAAPSWSATKRADAPVFSAAKRIDSWWT